MLAARKMELAVERTQADRRISGIEYRGAQVELALAKEQLHRCAIQSPISGEVVEVFKHAGEWVDAGEPIVHIMRLDTLRVEGFADARVHRPAEIRDRQVCVAVELAGGKRVEVPGRIVYVRPTLQAGQQYLVYAEVKNQVLDEVWVLRPGMLATMRFPASGDLARESNSRTSNAVE
jgi:multidrug efflux pump subunit AcrA (membrane-fusion protein)